MKGYGVGKNRQVAYTVLGTLLFVGSQTACGLNEQEQAVVAANESIQAVEEAAQKLAETIAGLSGEPTVAERSTWQEKLQQYMEKMEHLNASIRQLGTVFPAMQSYLHEQFRPMAEEAARACQQGLDLLQQPAAQQEELRTAITHIGRCVDRYADEVNSVSQHYTQTSP